MPLFFRCKSCGEEHPSPLAFSSQTQFERTHLASNSFGCSRSKNYARYRKSDLFRKVEVELSPLSLWTEDHLSVAGTDLAESRVLVVDDEPPMVLMLEHLLKRAGYQHIAVSSDSPRCADLNESFRPDLIILDLQMPELDGFGVLEQLRPRLAADEYLPVLVLTSDVEPETRHRALASGARDFLNKPFDRVEALLRIRNLLESRLLHLRLRRYTTMLEEKLQER